MIKGYSLEYGCTGPDMPFLLTIPSQVKVLLSLKLLRPCSLYVWLGGQQSAISQTHASPVSYKLCLSKYVNPVANLYQAIAWKFCP